MIPLNKMDALLVLAPNSKFVLDADGVMINHTLKNGDSLPTDKEIDTKLASMISDFDAQEYARNRKIGFPSIGDQLDMLFHDMTAGNGTKDGEWYKAVAKVKSDNPKP